MSLQLNEKGVLEVPLLYLPYASNVQVKVDESPDISTENKVLEDSEENLSLIRVVLQKENENKTNYHT